MLEYTVDVESKETIRALDRLGADVADINATALGKIAMQTTRQSEKEYFRPGGDEAGPNTQRGPGSLRRVTGKLAQSLTHRLISNYEAEVGTNIDYAAVHEFGGTTVFQGRSVKVPPRPYLGPALDDMWETGTAQKILNREFAEQLQRRFDR